MNHVQYLSEVWKVLFLFILYYCSRKLYSYNLIIHTQHEAAAEKDAGWANYLDSLRDMAETLIRDVGNCNATHPCTLDAIASMTTAAHEEL